MIMLAKVVSYGGNSVRYALEKENAKTVKVNNMPDGLDPTAIWYMMKHHCQYHQAERTVGRKLERFMTTFVLSPSKAEFANFTNSMNVGGLHSDSKSGTLHLHIDCCRVDMEGNTNDVHDIHLRAMKAAEIINMRHGWEQPQEIRNMRKVELAEDCEHILKDMQQFNIDRYFNLLRMKGYEVKPRYDRQRKLVGYTVGKNASVFKASEIGRKFMASKIEDTWLKLHPQPTQVKTKPVSPSVAPAPRPVSPVIQTPTASQPKAQPQITQTAFTINIGDEVKKVWIPNSVKDVFTNEVQIPEDNDIATTENVAHVAMLLFAGYIDAATSMSESCGGGGSAPSSGWGKKDDEDDWKFAHRCAQMAHSMCKPKPRSRSFHR